MSTLKLAIRGEGIMSRSAVIFVYDRKGKNTETKVLHFKRGQDTSDEINLEPGIYSLRWHFISRNRNIDYEAELIVEPSTDLSIPENPISEVTLGHVGVREIPFLIA